MAASGRPALQNDTAMQEKGDEEEGAAITSSEMSVMKAGAVH